MKKLLALLILTFVFTATSFAQDKAADVDRLLKSMNTDKMIDGMMNSMLIPMKQQAGSQFQGADAKEKSDKYFAFMVEEMKILSKKLRNEEMPAIYDKYFSHDEIKDLIKFYESPTGKKLLDTTPQFTMDMMQSMQTKYMPEFQERMREKMEGLK